MEYEGYFTKDEVLERVEESFPFISKPIEGDFYNVGANDLLRKIIQSEISKFNEAELPCEGVHILYDEFPTISQNAVRWMFPSLLRIIIEEIDTSDTLHWYLLAYFDWYGEFDSNSAYDLSWLSKDQLLTLNIVFEYIAEVYGDSVSTAQDKLDYFLQRYKNTPPLTL